MVWQFGKRVTWSARWFCWTNHLEYFLGTVWKKTGAFKKHLAVDWIDRLSSIAVAEEKMLFFFHLENFVLCSSQWRNTLQSWFSWCYSSITLGATVLLKNSFTESTHLRHAGIAARGFCLIVHWLIGTTVWANSMQCGKKINPDSFYGEIQMKKSSELFPPVSSLCA